MMGNPKMQKEIWTILLLAAAVDVHIVASIYVSPYDLMKCSYGERGSLTATCINATAGYFKSTPYRFDQLDETLRCVNCSIKTMDTGTFDISGNQIKNLDLTSSQIELIKQKAFIGLIFLENLYLPHNKIRSIYPGTFTGVKKIKHIDLSYNQISILSDDGFLELLNLEKLNLEHSYIHTISPRAFNGLVHLKQLYLKSNLISEVKDAFSNLTSLEVLNLEDNQIVALNSTEFYNLTALLELNLANNKLKNLVIEFAPQSVLRNLFLQNNFIDIIASNFLKGLHTLESLDLSHNQISEVNRKTLQNLYNLHKLNISYNKLTKFQTGTFSGLPQMELLNCSHNSIEEVEITGVFSLHSLHALDLSYNKLSDLDYVGLISRLPRLSYLKLENNVLPCYLETEMDEYFAEDNFKYVLYDNSVGSMKCVDTPNKMSRPLIPDKFFEEKPVQTGASGTEITTFVLISIVAVCIAFLFYLQYRTYQQLKYSSSQRTTSVVNLLSTDLENRE
ncbi:toll-like receptor 3 isoform X1 [Anoplophora glabripennis]|uniref:Insulin-like growth factor-binding protein complex acid labile subunit n=1 Tax=Anoplophora glabripennis TaxID=217634 RepID=V5GRK4_ANOGL|nr:toll-like receptor 3 isoform X1 [Anoplophora glabripennis]